jgi:protein AFG1
MLMDLFYATVPPHLTRRRRRVHFHAFMIDVHKRAHRVKGGSEGRGGLEDPILYVARELANEAVILCFDEFQAGPSARSRLTENNRGLL